MVKEKKKYLLFITLMKKKIPKPYQMLSVVQFINNWVYCHGRIKKRKGNKLFPNFYQIVFQEEEEKTHKNHTTTKKRLSYQT